MSIELPNESNTKRLVLEFFDLAFVKREPAQAAERYLGASYTQHNAIGDFSQFMQQFETK